MRGEITGVLSSARASILRARMLAAASCALAARTRSRRDAASAPASTRARCAGAGEPADRLARGDAAAARTLLTFTRPYFGTASSMSKTFAVSTYSGGSRSRSWIEVAPGLEIALELGAAGANVFARWSASMRWMKVRSGAATSGLLGVFAAGGMGGEST